MRQRKVDFQVSSGLLTIGRGYTGLFRTVKESLTVALMNYRGILGRRSTDSTLQMSLQSSKPRDSTSSISDMRSRALKYEGAFDSPKRWLSRYMICRRLWSWEQEARIGQSSQMFSAWSCIFTNGFLSLIARVKVNPFASKASFPSPRFLFRSSSYSGREGGQGG